MSKVIKRLNAYGMGGTFDQPGYEYDPVNDTFKDLETGKVFSKEYVKLTSGTGTGTLTVKLETNKEVSITANGEIEITPTSGKDGMEKVTANVAVPVPVLESNKAQTIDVSTYTEPVEITPTSGKDGMEKTTVTLSNIPSVGEEVIFYCWTGAVNVYTMSEHPNVGDYAYEAGYSSFSVMSGTRYLITAVGDNTITFTYDGDDTVENRDSEVNDLHFVKSST